MRVVADTEICIGAGQCVRVAPALFDQTDEDGTVIVLDDHPANPERAQHAVDVCPSGALSLAED